MPSRAASVQMRMRSGSFAGSALKRRFKLLAADQRRRAGEGRDPVVRLQIVERFGQPLFHPAPRVLVFGEEDQPPVIPAAVRRHVGPNPFGQPPDARVGPVGVLPGDLQHLVHEREVGDTGCNSACRLGRLVFLLLDQLLPVCFVSGLVLCLGAAMDECFCCRRPTQRRRREGVLCDEPLRFLRRRRLTREASAANQRR